MNITVQKHLIEIFKAVADACDGPWGKQETQLIKSAYNEAMQDPDVLEFYSSLVDARHEEVYGKEGYAT